MYFQNLKNMTDSIGSINIPSKILEDFDFWLATRRTATKKYLCPSSFSKYSNLGFELALELFLISSEQQIGLLRPRFDIFIAEKNIHVDSTYNKESIPETYFDPHDNQEYPIDLERDIRIYFELLKEPDTKPTFVPKESSKPHGVGLTDFNRIHSKVSLSSRYR